MKEINFINVNEEWSSEDRGFTPWLEDHIERLNKRLDTSFEVLEREKETVSGLSVDLKIEDEERGTDGVVECQFGKSDHDHLGKLLTYLTTFDDKIAVWIVEEARYEHEKTIEWLNENTENLFYLVKIEIMEMDGSRGSLFTPIVVPSTEAKKIGKEKNEPSETDLKREKFWEELLKKSNRESTLFETISPKQRNWLGKGAGKSGLTYVYLIRMDWSGIELHINTGSKEENERIFSLLNEKKEKIEERFGDDLTWEPKENSKSCIIHKDVTEKGLNDEEEWDTIQEQMIDAMQRLYRALDDKVNEL